MGNSHEKILKQISELNLITSSLRFYKIIDLRLNFVLVSRSPPNIIEKLF